jgi:3-phenylpropionate/trans-cinnamate dioxygenase ferredoxin reductase component
MTDSGAVGSERSAGMVVVGGGLAAGKAVETLRAEGYRGQITAISDEPFAPYERPPLSKSYLLGTSDLDDVFVHDEAWYRDNEVDLRTGLSVTSVDLDSRFVVAGGQRVPFDKLLLATGSRVRTLTVPGADLAGIHYLRRIPDAQKLRDALAGGGRSVTVVGAGWIGLETAAAARTYGNEVTVVEPEPVPLNRVLGPQMGEVFGALHRDHGVKFRLGDGVSAFSGSAGRVSGVTTSSGAQLDADVVIVGVGISPAVELAQAAGLEVDNGILTDASLRTSHPDVFAAGDVARSFNPVLGRAVRVEHWANALDGGPVAARGMLGQEATHDRVPYFFSDQYDLGMEYAGLAGPGDYDEVVVRGDIESREFIAFWTKEQRLLAGMNVNVWDVTDQIQALIRSGHAIDPTRLADVDVPLESLVP